MRLGSKKAWIWMAPLVAGGVGMLGLTAEAGAGSGGSSTRPAAASAAPVDPIVTARAEWLRRLPPDLQEALRTSSDGLRELDSPIRDGGVMVRLEGRFRNLMVTTGSEKSRTVSCTADTEGGRSDSHQHGAGGEAR